jgi:hypothetical protein
MSNQRPGWKIVSMRLIGIVLGIAGLVAGYFWFYHLAPLRRLSDPVWRRQHSESAQWNEYQVYVQRFGWEHDGFSIVGRLGDKKAVEWVMEHIRPGDDILSCDSGHKAHGLRFLTNQAAGDSAEAWLAWWEQNKSKNQEDWIREGFRKHGLELQTPLTRENIVSLLKLAARIDEEKGGSPDYVQYNAFRWLRDSDFEPDKFTVKDIPSKDADRVLQGLVRFAKLSTRNPKGEGLGVLQLGEPIGPLDKYDTRPRWTEARFQVLANAAIFIPLCTGMLLVWVSFHAGHRRATTGRDIQEGG